MNIIKLKYTETIPENYTGIVEWENGDKYWYKNGNFHREDGPAIERANGSKEWWINGNLHREDGPAVEYSNGNKYWYIEGKRHNLNGPAIELANGTKEWWIDNESIKKVINISNKIFLGKEKGKFGIEWLKFLGEEGFEEYPLVPGIPPYEFRICKDISLDELLKVGV